jgi:hypothetical protein
MYLEMLCSVEISGPKGMYLIRLAERDPNAFESVLFITLGTFPNSYQDCY